MALFTPTAYWGEDSSPPAPFAPSDIPNLAAWYDASDTSTYRMSGTQIAGIQGRNGYGDDLDSAGNTYPVAGSTQNGLNTLYFNGSGLFVNPYNDPLATNGLHFAVGVFYPQNVNATKDSLWSLESTSYNYAVSANQSFAWWGEVDMGNGVGSNRIIGPFSSVNRENQWIIVSVVFTKLPSPNMVKLWINAHVGSSSSGWRTTYLTDLDTNQKLRIMANRSGGKKQEGRFGELLIYNGECGVPGTGDDNLFYRYQAEGYLAWKWGLQGSLPSTHLYKNAPP